MEQVHDDKLLTGLPREHGGVRLGPVVIRSRLGSGGMGAVYLAYHDDLKRDVAVKVLPFRVAERDPGVAARFVREARAAQKISHPSLVRAFEVGESEGLHYIVMEYVEGETASWLLAEEGRFSERRALEICLAAAEALREAHAQGVVHRDVKPGNILIGKDGAVKLADLGLAKDTTGEITEGLTHAGQVVGTPAFMSPEQATDASDVDERTDVYSLGATLYALLAGRTPHDAGNLYALIRKVVEEEPSDIRRLRPDVADSTRALVLRMMSKDRSKRFGRMQEVVSAVRLALDEASPAAPRRKLASKYTESPTPRKIGTPQPVKRASVEEKPAGAPPETRPAPRGPSRGSRAAALFLLACAGAGGLYLYREYRSEELRALEGPATSPAPASRARSRPGWGSPAESGRTNVQGAPGLLLFSGDGNEVLILSRGGMDFWRPGETSASWGKELAAVSFIGSRPDATSFALSGSFAVRVSAGGEVDVFDGSSGNATGRFELGEPCTAAAVSPDGRAVACGTAGGTVIVRKLDGGRVARLAGHGEAIRALAYSPDGRLLAAAASDGLAVAWDASSFASGDVLPPVSSAPRAVAFSPDSSLLAYATGGGVEIWKIESHERLTAIGSGEGASAVAFDLSGRRLATGFDSGLVVLWRPSGE